MYILICCLLAASQGISPSTIDETFNQREVQEADIHERCCTKVWVENFSQTQQWWCTFPWFKNNVCLHGGCNQFLKTPLIMLKFCFRNCVSQVADADDQTSIGDPMSGLDELSSACASTGPSSMLSVVSQEGEKAVRMTNQIMQVKDALMKLRVQQQARPSPPSPAVTPKDDSGKSGVHETPAKNPKMNDKVRQLTQFLRGGAKSHGDDVVGGAPPSKPPGNAFVLPDHVPWD